MQHSDFEGGLYIAGPLFSLAERSYIEQPAEALTQRMPRCPPILPHRYAASIAGSPDFLDRVFQWCLANARGADAMVAILDGADADSGTCIEMGTVYGRVPIIGVRTDLRSLEDQGVNVMVSKLCTEVIWLADTSATIDQVADRIAVALERLPKP